MSALRSRVLNLGIRGKILSVGAVGLLGALILAAVNLCSLTSLNGVADEIDAATTLQKHALEISESVSSVKGDQNAYLIEAEHDGAQAATGQGRKDYETASALLDQQLANIEQPRTEEGQAALQQIKAGWSQFSAIDQQVIGLVRGNAEGSTERAQNLALQQGAAAADSMTEASSALVATTESRVAAAQQAQDDATNRTGIIIANTLLVVLALLTSVALAISRRIVSGIESVRVTMEAMGRGDLTVPARVDSGDEVGRMAQAAEETRTSIAGLLAQVGQVSSTVAASSEELSANAAQSGSTTAASSQKLQGISVSADDFSRNVQTVAAGTEEMTASIREIAKSANEAASVAGSTAHVADRTNETVAKLGDSSAQIGEVVKAITSIAEQTNLLALNATIETARAGEAGKGFAVVANEIKDLAQETGKATEDIGRRVEAIQLDTEAAVQAIGEIAQIIAQINDTSRRSPRPSRSRP